MTTDAGTSDPRQLMFWWAEPPAKASPLPERAADSKIHADALCSPTSKLLNDIDLVGSFGKTSLVSCHPAGEGILAPSSGGWRSAGMGSLTESWTLSMCEWTDSIEPSRNEDGVSSLSDILEVGEVQPRYYLSRKACAGILRRAAQRGKTLPPALTEALKAVT